VSERLITAREVASLLNVSAETVLRWTRRGELPAFKLPGGAIRYRDADLEAWLKARVTGAANRGGDSHRGGRAHRAGYGLSSVVTATTPRGAATTEENSDAC
jgi:excisionase family DNA binding protein